jgi:hypothetical protein
MEATPFYGGAIAVIPKPPATPPVVVVKKTFVDYLPLILAIISVALTLYILSEQKSRQGRRI